MGVLKRRVSHGFTKLKISLELHADYSTRNSAVFHLQGGTQNALKHDTKVNPSWYPDQIDRFLLEVSVKNDEFSSSHW